MYRKLMIFAVFLLFLASFVSADTYYVATNGNNSDDGSEDNPWETVQKACNTLEPGDTVFIKAGTYNEKVEMNVEGSASGGCVVIMNYQDDAVIMDGSGVTGGNIILIENKSYIHIEGLEICNNTSTDCPVGIRIEGQGTSITIRKCVVHDIEKPNDNAHGIGVWGTNGSNPMDSVILDSNEIYDCHLGQSEAMVLNGNVTNFQIINNTVHDNDNIAIDMIGFEGTANSNDQARNGICRGNHCYNISSGNNPTYGGDKCADGIYVDGGKDIIIERNIIDNCDIGIEIASEHSGKTTSSVIIRNNFVSRSYLSNILIGGYASGRGNADDIVVVHNTTYQGNDGELALQFNCNRITIKNNGSSDICVGSHKM